MSGLVETASEADLKFLAELDSRLHYVKEYGTRFGQRVVDLYHRDAKMDSQEALRVLQIVQRNTDLILHPINTDFGFSVGFSVAQVVAPFPGTEEYDSRLCFIREQLPKGYGWKELAEVFNSRENLDRVQATGLAKQLGTTPNEFREESNYEY